MIRVYGSGDSQERKAALRLAQKIRDAWPQIERSEKDEIHLVPQAKCLGQTIEDVDILLLARFDDRDLTLPAPSPDGQANTSVRMRVYSLCVAIEEKSHAASGVRFEGNKVSVRYNNKWSDASEQNAGQARSVKQYLRRCGIQVGWVSHLLLMSGISSDQAPDGFHNIVFSDTDWPTVLRLAAEQYEPVQSKAGNWYIDCARPESLEDLLRSVDVFTKPARPTRLDRSRMERITATVLKDQDYGNQFGQQLLVFRGRGGTGKTVRLLGIAHQLHREQAARVLILTWNKALVADIKRLLWLIGIGDDLSRRSVGILTVQSFMYRLLNALHIIDADTDDFLRGYDGYIGEAAQCVAAITQADREELFQQGRTAFTWDYIFIDEGQDWPMAERDILFSVYGPNNVVVADGMDQLVRQGEPCDWVRPVASSARQIVHLRKSLRLKRNICAFALRLMDELGYAEWDIEPQDEMTGGTVLVVEGKYSRSCHTMLMDRNREDNNEPIDTLFCVSPDMVREGGRERYSTLATRLSDWGYQCWDGVSGDVRSEYPTEVEQIRIVQYESCRGLESWLVVAFWIDRFFSRKYQEGLNLDLPRDLFTSPEELAKRYACQWLTIPLTRAIDTLVLHVDDEQSEFKSALRRVAEELPDVVEWRSATTETE